MKDCINPGASLMNYRTKSDCVNGEGLKDELIGLTVSDADSSLNLIVRSLSYRGFSLSIGVSSLATEGSDSCCSF